MPATRPTPAPRHWELRRRCALAPAQLVAALGAAAALTLLPGLLFWVLGYPWVMAFAVVEAAALGAALVAWARRAGDRDAVWLRQGRLLVERQRGELVERFEFDPLQARVRAPREDPSDPQGRLVVVAAGARRIAIGGAATPPQRQRLARELRQALCELST